MLCPGPFVPAVLALLFAVACGTFGLGSGWGAPGAGWALVGVGWLLVLAAAATVGRDWRDPWRLGPAGSLLPWALVAAVVLSWRVSPVPRAGTVGVLVLPAFLWLPAVLAAPWRSTVGRRRGARAISAVVAAVAGAALVLWLAGVTPRPALPVGQHLHLTVWLTLLLPLAVLPWRDRGPWRWLAGAAGGLAVAAVVAGRTLSGGLALGVEAGLGLLWYGRSLRRTPAGRRRLALLAAAAAVLASAGLVFLWSDVAAVVRGTDPSLAARRVYWRAGWDGLLERPAVGLGPGSTAWTLALFLRPVPGVNPPSEVVGELHLLPLGVAYELGVPGLLLAAAATGLFAWRRLRDRGAATDPGLLGAGLVGLAGGAVTGLATADWRVTALPLAAAVATGAALAGATGVADARSRRAGTLVAGVYVVVAAALLIPLLLAHRAYDRAVDAPRAQALRLLDRAIELDPGFPLYRARRGWLEAEDAAAGAAAAEASRRGSADSLAAARGALGVGPLWLAAGAAAEAAGDRSAAALSYERACSLDPLGALPPFRLAQVGSPLHDPLAVAARSLAAEPRLVAATWWWGRRDLLDRAVLHLATTDGIALGWRASLAETVDAQAAGKSGGATEELALVFDANPESSVSLHLFRRRPWWARLVPVPVDAAAAQAFAGLPAATALAGTDPQLFPPTCTGPFVPQRLRKTLWKSW